jgi:hypothetical protein
MAPRTFGESQLLISIIMRRHIGSRTNSSCSTKKSNVSLLYANMQTNVSSPPLFLTVERNISPSKVGLLAAATASTTQIDAFGKAFGVFIVHDVTILIVLANITVTGRIGRVTINSVEIRPVDAEIIDQQTRRFVLTGRRRLVQETNNATGGGGIVVAAHRQAGTTIGTFTSSRRRRRQRRSIGLRL